MTDAGHHRGTMVVMAGTARGMIHGISPGTIPGMILGIGTTDGTTLGTIPGIMTMAGAGARGTMVRITATTAITAIHFMVAAVLIVIMAHRIMVG